MVPVPPGTQALTRALRLLKVFSDARPAWRLSDLARTAQLHKATTHRLLGALEREGMVARDPTGEWYRLGPEAIALGARAARANDLRTVSRAELLALAAATGETATLEVPVGREMLILDEVPGRGILGATPSIGTRWPLHATSTGKAVLASMPRAERARLLGSRLATPTARTLASRAAVERDLARIHRRGYAVAQEELELGFVAVGAAVHDRDGHPIGALSVGGAAPRFPAARVASLGRRVRRAADRMTAALGYRTPSPGPGPC